MTDSESITSSTRVDEPGRPVRERFTARGLHESARDLQAGRIRWGTVGWIVVLAALALNVIGIVAIATTEPGFARKQALFLPLGLIVAAFIAVPDYRRLRPLVPGLSVLVLALLVFVLIPFVPTWIVRPVQRGSSVDQSRHHRSPAIRTRQGGVGAGARRLVPASLERAIASRIRPAVRRDGDSHGADPARARPRHRPAVRTDPAGTALGRGGEDLPPHASWCSRESSRCPRCSSRRCAVTSRSIRQDRIEALLAQIEGDDRYRRRHRLPGGPGDDPRRGGPA